MYSVRITRVVVAEDNEFVRIGIKKLLLKAPDIHLVGEAKNGMEALKLVSELLPNVLLLDVELPVMDGIQVANAIRKQSSNTQILVLSAYDDDEYIREMLANGAAGYLIKDEAPERILEAVRGVALGKRGLFSSRVRAKLRDGEMKDKKE